MNQLQKQQCKLLNNDNCAQIFASIHTFCVATTFIDAEKCKTDNAIKIRAS